METTPTYIAGTFITIVLALIGFIYYAVNAASNSKKDLTPAITLALLFSWIFVICTLTFNDFFQDFSMPPRLFIFVGLTIISIVVLFAAPKSRAFLNKMPITTLTYLHIIRVPVEIVLWWLAISGLIPLDLTFEGSNLDIISGISAPFAAVFMVSGKSINRIGAIIWNVLAIGLLFNIVLRAISYTPYFYEQVAGGEVANNAMFHFPYVLLPTFVVPVVLFSHLVCLYQLFFKKDQSQY
ncbi:MAG: hypothetical protein AB8B73_13875 [Ekhidna sp.]